VVAGSIIAAMLLSLVAACTSSGSDDGTGDGAAASSTTSSPRDVRRPTIRLGVTDWTAARANAAIAERIIERRLGFPVETVEVTDIARLFTDLETGRVDAILELWTSSLEDSELETIASEAVAELGPLGVEGRIGWWVPRYVAEGDLGVTSWEDLVDPTVAAAFAGPAGGSTGRLLGTDPGYEQFDEQLVEALGLPFEVSYTGSDGATAAEVGEAVAAQRPVLVYWWTPTALVARYDLVDIALPPRTDACAEALEAGEAVPCGYPVDRLVKLGSPDLATKAPEVEAFLRAFTLTTEDQLGIIDQVENGGLAIDQAADRWVAANTSRWAAWLD
jgi:glycine betaine/proline transport system substrate-binding protein